MLRIGIKAKQILYRGRTFSCSLICMPLNQRIDSLKGKPVRHLSVNGTQLVI